MANEAIQVEGPYAVYDLTVATGTAIPQFTLLQLTDNRTGSASSGAQVWGGIAMTEKTTTDGVVNMGAAKSGIWNLKDSGSGGSAGALVVLAAANTIKDAIAADLLTGKVIGRRLQDASASEVTEIQLGDFA